MCGTSKVIGPKGPKAHNKIYINRRNMVKKLECSKTTRYLGGMFWEWLSVMAGVIVLGQ